MRDENKKAAVDYLNMIVEGRIDEAYEKYIDMNGKHHNAYHESGFEALKKGMKDNDAQFPNKKYEIKHVLADDELVSIHGRMILDPGKTEVSVVHLMKFKNGRIVEMWDCGQIIPAHLPNKDGMF